MGKISINIDIPAIGQQHEFLVPDSMSVRDLTPLIVKVLVSEYGIFGSNPEVMLFDKEDNKALRLECSLSQQGISDSAKLTLI